MQYLVVFGMSMPRTEGFMQTGPLFFAVSALVAASCIVAGVYFSNRRRAWLQHSVLTQGIVVDVYKKYLRDDKAGTHPLYFPIVWFNINGKAYEHTLESATDAPVKVGETVEVRYNPNSPEEVAVGSTEAPGMNPKVFYILGAVFLLLSSLLLA
ncbi:MAG: DUF3592 domain-containing protein [Spirosomataceae bacterium]